MADKKLTDLGAFASTLTASDLIHLVDVSNTAQDPAGSSFKLTIGQLSSYLAGVIDTNIYNSDGTLAGNRIVDLNTNVLNFEDGQTTFKGQNTANTHFTLKAIDSTSANLFVVRNDGNIGIGTGSPQAKFNIVGNGSTSATTSVLVQNSSSFETFKILDDSQVVFRSNVNKSIIVQEDGGTGRLGVYIDDTSGHINFSSNNSFFRYWKGGTQGHGTTTNHLLSISPGNGRFTFTNDSADGEYDSWKFYVNISAAADRAYFKNTYSGANTGFQYALYATAITANSGTNVGLYVEAGAGAVDNTAIRAYGDIENYNNSAAYYFGAKATDSTWRILRSGNNLVFERREAGVYVTKNTITP